MMLTGFVELDLANNQIPAVTDQMVIAAPSRAAVVESSCAHMVLFYYLTHIL